MALTPDLSSVLLFLRSKIGEWVQPTTVGMEIGQKTYSGASSWGSAKLKGLVNLGFAEKDGGRYRITEEGIRAADAIEESRRE
jgi:predicted transcriptional regulator